VELEIEIKLPIKAKRTRIIFNKKKIRREKIVGRKEKLRWEKKKNST